MRELPARLPLSEVAEFEMGQSPPSSFVHDRPEDGIPFLQGNADFTAKNPAARQGCSQPQKVCRDGDVLISVRAPVGAINVADRAYCIGRGLSAVRFLHADRAFGTHALRFAAPALRRVSQGTTFEAVGRRELQGLCVWLPPLPEQRHIAEILDTLDEAIRKTEEIIAKLKQVKQGLLHDLLTHGIDDNGELRDPVRHPELFKDSPLGQIPKGWEVKPCEDVSSGITVGIVVRPTQYYRDTGVPVLRSANVREEGVVLTDLKFMSSKHHCAMAKTAVTPGDLLTVRTGYPGTTAIVPSSLPAANCVDIIITRPSPLVDPHFLALWVNSDFGKGQVLRKQGGLAQQHFNVGEMKKLLVALPTLNEQQTIAERANTVVARAGLEAEEMAKLRLLKQGLMDDLLTGRVRVTPLLDEAA